MKQKMRIGVSDFLQLRRDDGYFVDKTLLVKAVIDGSAVILLPRPRRFGKTLNMSVLRYFFEKSDVDHRPLFDGTAIVDDEESMRHFGQYPVIALSLKSCASVTWEDAWDKIVERIARLFKEHACVRASIEAEDDQDSFDRVATRQGTRSDVENSLANLVTWVYRHYRQPVVLLLDEYDYPIIEAWRLGYYDQMIAFMRQWLGEGLKHENGAALYRAVVTGILRVAKESIFSGLNNLTVRTTLNSGDFADKFGFTQQELDRMLDDFNVPQLREPVREWYNGYKFGGTVIYNPWSVINAVDTYPEPLQPHWLNTASNHLIHAEMEKGGMALKKDLQKLLEGEALRYPIVETTTFHDIGKSCQNIWSFLFHSGYLNASDPVPNPMNDNYTLYRLSIPNREVSLAYEQFINRFFDDAENGGGVAAFLECFKDDEHLTLLERELSDLMLGLVSHHDTARYPEAFIHAFILGLLANLRSAYDIQSNPEVGYGRADITMRPTKPEYYPLGFVIELKAAPKTRRKLDGLAAEALEQIARNQYAARLRSQMPEKDIRHIAIVMAGKRIACRVSR